MSTYTIGLDFGTESARALLLDYSAGIEVAVSEFRYPSGVICDRLPIDGADPLPPDWALQDPQDYRLALEHTIRELLQATDVSASEIIGIGVDFTSCTMLPVTRDGTPLSFLDRFRGNPHAWVKLWKHHAAQPHARRINDLARRLDVPWLARYGGRVSSEWMLPKIMQILDEDPAVYEAAGFFVEAADWMVWQLTGRPQTSVCTAGYKSLWSSSDGFPGLGFLRELDPRLETLYVVKTPSTVVPVGSRAGTLSEPAAEMLGLRPGTPVAAAVIDAHASVPGTGVAEPSQMVLIMGTSLCQLILDTDEHPVRGIAGVVDGGVVPGLFAYEAGQPGLGDAFAWAARLVGDPAGSDDERFSELESRAAAVGPGASGLLALDWLNGNRSILDDSELSGALIGMTLGTTKGDVYRSVMEASAFGTRLIIEEFERNGIAVDRLVACGGLAHRSELFVEILADVCRRPIRVASSRQTSALGTALYAAVAAGRDRGGAESIVEAAAHVAPAHEHARIPDEAAGRVYDRLFADYRLLYEYFGRENDVMHRLRRLRSERLSVSGRTGGRSESP